MFFLGKKMLHVYQISRGTPVFFTSFQRFFSRFRSRLQNIDLHLPNYSLIDFGLCFGSWSCCLTETCSCFCAKIDLEFGAIHDTLVSSHRNAFSHVVCGCLNAAFEEHVRLSSHAGSDIPAALLMLLMMMMMMAFQALPGTYSVLGILFYPSPDWCVLNPWTWLRLSTVFGYTCAVRLFQVVFCSPPKMCSS